MCEKVETKYGCNRCKNFQAFYVKADGKFFLTNRGYCCKEGITTNCNYLCGFFSLQTTEEEYVPLTKDNLQNAILFLKQLLENIGVYACEEKVKKCKTVDEKTPYNNKLKKHDGLSIVFFDKSCF